MPIGAQRYGERRRSGRGAGDLRHVRCGRGPAAAFRRRLGRPAPRSQEPATSRRRSRRRTRPRARNAGPFGLVASEIRSRGEQPRRRIRGTELCEVGRPVTANRVPCLRAPRARPEGCPERLIHVRQETTWEASRGPACWPDRDIIFRRGGVFRIRGVFHERTVTTLTSLSTMPARGGGKILGT